MLRRRVALGGIETGSHFGCGKPATGPRPLGDQGVKSRNTAAGPAKALRDATGGTPDLLGRMAADGRTDVPDDLVANLLARRGPRGEERPELPGGEFAPPQRKRRVAWLPDGSLALGDTNRGWASRGEHGHGLTRLVWTGRTPFETHRMRAVSGGFRLEFNERVDPATAGDPASYEMTSYIYYHHEPYGSPEIDTKPCAIVKATVAEDGKSVELAVEGLREVYVHELHAKGVRNAAGVPLLHARAYYTLNRFAHHDSTSAASGTGNP